MVTITNYLVKSKEEKTFILLELQGDMEFAISQQTGKYYATARKCTIPCTFNETVAKTMIGKQMPGSIIKKECEPYEYTVQETGEVVTLSFRYEYVPVESSTLEHVILEPEQEQLA